MIYARVEGVHAKAEQAAQLKLARLLRERQQAKSADDSPLGFGSMATPLIAKLAFLAAVVLGLFYAIYAVVVDNYLEAVGALFGVLVVRIALESVVVLFRMLAELTAIRELLADQALLSVRAAATPSNSP